jgi:hypothetical protein
VISGWSPMVATPRVIRGQFAQRPSHRVPLPSAPGRVPDAYRVMLDAELSKAFDVWSGYLDAQVRPD